MELKLDAARWRKKRGMTRLLDALGAAQGLTRYVGGAVRDDLLGEPVSDIDLATKIAPDEVMRRLEQAKIKAVPTGIEHGTVTVIADGVPFQVTTLRRDVETYGRHATVAFTEDWEEDARRRDFTLNALYADRDGTVFDPLGGYRDLQAGRVRFIGDAEARIKEDYLRILRFFRFNAYYGRGPLDEEGLAASVRLRAGIEQLSAERVGAEMRRLLVAPGALRAIEALFDYGLLAEVLGGVPRLARFARLIAIEEALGLTPDAALRLAGLAVFVREDAPRLAARLRLSNAEQAVLELGAADHAMAELPDEGAAKRALYALGQCAFEAHVLIAWADSGASPDEPSWRQALTLADRWQAPAFPLRGGDIVALGDLKGPAIGDMLRRLERDWVDGGFAEDRDALLAKAATLAGQAGSDND